MLGGSPIDKIVASLRKMEERLKEYAELKAKEEDEALSVAARASAENARATKIAKNLQGLLGDNEP